MTTFASLNLIPPVQSALETLGYEDPTPIQAQAIPYLLEGRDLLGIAQTGTGKTAAFALPICDGLGRRPRKPRPNRPRVLVLTPTRELAAQIDDSFRKYGQNLDFRSVVIFGGVGQKKQTDALAQGVDVLVATPGRLLDLMGQGFILFDRLGVFILDEADRMLDMGFIRDVRRVVAELPEQRQTLLFSATMPESIAELARSMLVDPARVEVTPPATTVERVSQRVYLVDKPRKRDFLREFLLQEDYDRTLVFTRTKHGANRVARSLGQAGIEAAAIHGNKSQTARERALGRFRAGEIRVLVATDIAARGIDVAGISHVVNFDLPNEPESYVHRIGRTARAGREGVAVSMCEETEVSYLRSIERLIRQPVPVVEEQPFHSEEVAAALAKLAPRGRPQARKQPVPTAPAPRREAQSEETPNKRPRRRRPRRPPTDR